MSFDASPIRSALIFSRCYERFAYSRDFTLTRKQVLFLAFIIENGHFPQFQTNDLLKNGIRYDQAYQYLRILRQKYYLTKTMGNHWQLTPKAIKFYKEFTALFDRYYNSRNFWT